ncbi:MAG: hypothetical protein ACI9MR_002752 [Myxococcota bacterium]|jgi:hypothetical protein
MNLQTISVVLAATAMLGFGFGCDSDSGSPRPNGATCGLSSQCESGICGGGTCLDPAVDTDADGLLNGVEAALGTDPTQMDSDGDGKLDLAEVGDMIASPIDIDGDGQPDAAESDKLDLDHDCIPDERDPQNTKFQGNLEVVADRACCCDGLCSEQEALRGVTVTAECIPSEGGVAGEGDGGAPAETDPPADAEPTPDNPEDSASGASLPPSDGNVPKGTATIAQQNPPVLRCTASAATEVPLAPCGGGAVDTTPPGDAGGEF